MSPLEHNCKMRKESKGSFPVLSTWEGGECCVCVYKYTHMDRLGPEPSDQRVQARPVVSQNTEILSHSSPPDSRDEGIRFSEGSCSEGMR